MDIPQSKIKQELARILKREGYILDHTLEVDDNRKILKVYLKYGVDEESVIQGLRRVSKPGLRRYVHGVKAHRVLGGLGIAILSTSQGILTDREARRKLVGGEVLCYVW